VGPRIDANLISLSVQRGAGATPPFSTRWLVSAAKRLARLASPLTTFFFRKPSDNQRFLETIPLQTREVFRQAFFFSPSLLRVDYFTFFFPPCLIVCGSLAAGPVLRNICAAFSPSFPLSRIVACSLSRPRPRPSYRPDLTWKLLRLRRDPTGSRLVMWLAPHFPFSLCHAKRCAESRLCSFSCSPSFFSRQRPVVFIERPFLAPLR